MIITTVYLLDQKTKLEEMKKKELAAAQTAYANIAAIDGALQALTGLITYADTPEPNVLETAIESTEV